MPKDEWGLKRACPSCATRFYDLQHDPMTCPSCGATFSAESLLAGKSRPVRLEKVKPQAADIADVPDIEAEDDEVIDTEADIEDDILEDEEDNVDLDEIADVPADDEES